MSKTEPSGESEVISRMISSMTSLGRVTEYFVGSRGRVMRWWGGQMGRDEGFVMGLEGGAAAATLDAAADSRIPAGARELEEEVPCSILRLQ